MIGFSDLVSVISAIGTFLMPLISREDHIARIAMVVSGRRVVLYPEVPASGAYAGISICVVHNIACKTSKELHKDVVVERLFHAGEVGEVSGANISNFAPSKYACSDYKT